VLLKTLGLIFLIEVLQFLCILVLFDLLWKFYLRDKLPKAWVDNLVMMGFVMPKKR